MPTVDAIRWFKSHFHRRIDTAVAGTPFTVDMLTAIACQETGHFWNILRNRMTTAEVLALCVGDTLDATKGRKAFPKTKADLLAKPNGQQMFDIARKALVDMSQFISGFQRCRIEPEQVLPWLRHISVRSAVLPRGSDYFLQQRYADFEASLAKALEELKSKQRKIGLSGRTTVTELEVDVRATMLNVRRDPIIPAGAPASNVIAKLPDGHVVRSTGRKRNSFVEVETSLSGALIRGFVDARS